MRRMVIKVPAPGRKTVQLVTHQYVSRQQAKESGIEHGTRTVYLGSFSLDLDPRKLLLLDSVTDGDSSSGITLRPGVIIDGKPFELTREDIQEIASWLEVHGTRAAWQRASERLAAAEEQRRQKERVELEAQLREELEGRLRETIRAEVLHEMELQAGHPLEEAMRAVEKASERVLEEAAQLKEQGHRLVARRGREGASNGDPVTRLFEQTIALRKAAFAKFEDACKTAGLMARKTTGSNEGKRRGRRGSGA